MVDILEQIKRMSGGGTEVLYTDSDGQIRRGVNGEGYDIIVYGGPKTHDARYKRLRDKLTQMTGQRGRETLKFTLGGK